MNFQVDEIIATLSGTRGIETFEQILFFEPSLEDLHDPYLMKDMDLAVNPESTLIKETKKTFLFFGDYDVDGTTAVSLVSSYL
jgi:single-stranded-DNA-specific exonuclease